MPHRMHSPLDYNYHSHRPLTTLFWLMDRPWWFYTATVVALWVKYAPVLLMPLLTAFVINQLTAETPEFVLFSRWWVIPAVVVVLSQNILTNFIYSELLSFSTRKLERNLRASLTRRLQQLSISFHDSARSGKLQSKMLRDVEMVFGLAQHLLTGVPQMVLTFFWAVGYTAWKQPRILLFFLILVPLALVIERMFRRPLKETSQNYRGDFEAMSAKVSEMVEMVPITRAHGVEAKEVTNVDNHLETVRHRGRLLDRVSAFFGSIQWVSMMSVQAMCLATLTWMAVYRSLEIGYVMLYMTLFNMIIGSVNGFIGMLPFLAKSFESIRSLGDVLECPDIEANEGKARVENVDGRITFENVSFQYPEADTFAIKDFSIDIKPGECVAFVGESGGGKSTIMSLVIGFHRATHGRLLLDGADMQTIDMRDFRSHIAVVPQRTILFGGSIRDNILYGMPEQVNDEHLREVIEAANVAEFADKLSDGLETVIGERGARISGGQQQRISIARALIRNPEIILLDEATSALDVISEALVQEAINRLVANRTTLIVAHRLSTVRKADRIAVMKRGKCIELGTPQELLEAKGEFSRLHNLQQMLL